MAKKQEVAVKSDQGMSIMTSNPRGFDNFDMKDLIVPRIRLLQGLSKAVSDGYGKLGQFQDSLTGEIIGDKVEIVLLGLKNGAVYFKAGEGMVCKSNDGITSIRGDICTSCPFNEYWGKFHSDGSPPGCSGTKEFISLLRPTIKKIPYPIVISFLKTSYGLGKRLASMARLSGMDIFASSYVIGSEKVQNNKGTFSKFTIEKGTNLDQEEMKVAEKWFYMLKNTNVQVAEESDLIVEEV